MSTAQGTPSARAPRGRHHGTAAQSPHRPGGKQRQRRARGDRMANGSSQHAQTSASPGKTLAAQAEVAVSEASGEERQLPTSSRDPKTQRSADGVLSASPHAPHSLTDSETNPSKSCATPAKIQSAYAGPTFHASPAPSALPIPKFLSRSVPPKSRTGPPTPPPEDSSDSATSPSPALNSPSRAPIPIPRRDDDSPLDLLFKAHRAERAKNGTCSPASNSLSSPPPPLQHRLPCDKHDSYGSLNAPFPIELDGHTQSLHVSSPPMASPGTARSVTDPNKVLQLKDITTSPNNTDVMQDLLSRLSQSQKKATAGTSLGSESQTLAGRQTRHETPSPSLEARSTIHSAPGPSTPNVPAQENPEFFYGNKNLSPLFKAAKNDTSKRNSGLRTEITADSPLVTQGTFTDFPIVSPPQAKTNNVNGSAPLAPGNKEVPRGPRNGYVPHVQPPRDNHNNRRRTPGRSQVHQPRQDLHSANVPQSTSYTGPPKPASNSPAPSAKKPITSMMSFVPASVAARQHSASTPPAASTPPPPTRSDDSNTNVPTTTTTPASDTLALEQDLKRLLNVKLTDNAPSVI